MELVLHRKQLSLVQKFLFAARIDDKYHKAQKKFIIPPHSPSFPLISVLEFIIVFLGSIAFPLWALSSSFSFDESAVVINVGVLVVSGLFVFICIKERIAKINYALEILYGGSNTQLFINSDRQFIKDVQTKIDDALEERLKRGAYIFDNSSNSVRVEG